VHICDLGLDGAIAVQEAFAGKEVVAPFVFSFYVYKSIEEKIP
jgi:hypothetical protein